MSVGWAPVPVFLGLPAGLDHSIHPVQLQLARLLDHGQCPEPPYEKEIPPVEDGFQASHAGVRITKEGGVVLDLLL